MSSAKTSNPDLLELIQLFYQQPQRLGEFVDVEPASLPDSYATLLAHNQHMTVTVEKFHGCPVELEVLETLRSDAKGQSIPADYSRKILLRRSTDKSIVQFGIVRLRLGLIAEQVARMILAGEIPLGRVLIDNGVMREVRLSQLWQIEAGEELSEYLGLDAQESCFGRTALIFCDGQAAIELLEIVVDR